MSWIVWGAFSAFFAAVGAILAKLGLEKFDSTMTATVRAVVMAAVLTMVLLAQRKWGLVDGLDRRAWVLIVLSGLAGAGSWMFYFLALKSGPASGVSGLDRLSLVLVVIGSAVFLGESFTWRMALGVVLAVVGGMLLVVK